MDSTKGESSILYFSYNNLQEFGNLSSGNSSTDLDLLGQNETEYLAYAERIETYIVPVLFGAIFVCGILGNASLIVILLRNRSMRNSIPNMYICSLAVGDILVIFFNVPFSSTVYTFESWPYGLHVCRFSEFIKELSIGVSVFTLTALSADRYIAIVDPMRKLAGKRASHCTCITILSIWILSIIIALPSGLFSYLRVIDENPKHSFVICYPFPSDFGDSYPKIMVMVKFLVFYLIPLLFIATFYILMAHHLFQSAKNMPGEVQGHTNKQVLARKKVAKMILSFVVLFAICFFPSHVFFLWFYFSPNALSNFNAYWNLVRILGFCLSFLNSVINPVALYLVSSTFRKHFNESLFCGLCKSGEGSGGRNTGSRIGGGQRVVRFGACGCDETQDTSASYRLFRFMNEKRVKSRQHQEEVIQKRNHRVWDSYPSPTLQLQHNKCQKAQKLREEKEKIPLNNISSKVDKFTIQSIPVQIDNIEMSEIGVEFVQEGNIGKECGSSSSNNSKKSLPLPVKAPGNSISTDLFFITNFMGSRNKNLHGRRNKVKN